MTSSPSPRFLISLCSGQALARTENLPRTPLAAAALFPPPVPCPLAHTNGPTPTSLLYIRLLPLFLRSTAHQLFDLFPNRQTLMDTRRDAEAELNLPPGFRFHPTDDELVVDYLVRKATGQRLHAPIISEIDLYKFDPWELPEMSLFGTKEWYFFTPRDRKYQNGSRPNRAAGRGYWKATGADKPVTPPGSRRPLGIKKALVFYHGKAPRGVKTDWIMHEYRLADVDRSANNKKDDLRLDDCVLCRLYNKKNNWEKKMKQMPTFLRIADSFDTNDDARSWSTKDSDAEQDAGAGGFQVVDAVKEEDDWFMDLNLDDFQSTMEAIGFGPASVVSISNQLDCLNQNQSNTQSFWN